MLEGGSMQKKDVVRERENFDRGWKFYKGDIDIHYAVKAGMTGGPTDCAEREKGEWLQIAFSDKEIKSEVKDEDWAEVELPHDWCIEGCYVHDSKAEKENLLHGYLRTGIGCYRKLFSIGEEDKGKKIYVEFDGVMRDSTLWINGHLMGTHLCGYTGFYYDITDVLRYGEEGANVMFVKVDATYPEGWWYEGAGIYRHVWLVKTDRLHVAHWGTYVTTPYVSESSARVKIETTVENDEDKKRTCELVSKIIGPNGRVLKELALTQEIDHDDAFRFVQHAEVEMPELWSPDTPSLYTLETELRYQGRLLDRYTTGFGIRSIEFTSDKGFFLNGKHTIIKGTSNHQDFAGVGVALPDSLIGYKLGLLKEMGCNAYRSAHHPPTPELLDACDRLGILVMDENRKLDSSPEGIANLESMLYRDRNHPSVILWSMENEEVLEGTPAGARILQSLVRRTHKIDPTRPTTAAMNHGRNEYGYGDIADIAGYNYGHNGNNADIQDHSLYPGRKIIGSESCSCTTARGIYVFDRIRGVCPQYATNIMSWGCNPEKAWTDLINHPFLTGVFIWTGFDYNGEPAPFDWPCVTSQYGMMDMCGIPKDWYYYCKSVWTDTPLVHLFPHWNWADRRDEEIEVWSFSNCETVELFLNGKSLGEKPMPKHGHLEWKVGYVPGELKAIGRNERREAAVCVVETTGAPAGLRLAPEKRALKADGCETSVVRVSIVDDNGRVVPTADNDIVFSVEGPGKILGVGNGNPYSHEPNKARTRRAFNGYCAAIIQSGREEGKIVLKAASSGLISCRVELDVRGGVF